MGFFDFFKTKAKYSEEPNECYIKDNLLFYKDHMETVEVNLNKLTYVYANMLTVDRLYLVMFDHKQHYIDTNQKGFSDCLKELANRFSFDMKTYNKISNSKEETKELIWRKTFDKNYEIIFNENYDLAKGFEVLSNPAQIISWDTTYEDFLKLDIGHLYQNESNINYYKVDFPVRLGTIIFDNFEFYYENNRKDIPVLSYFSEVYDSTNTDVSFDELKSEWLKMIPTKLEEAGYEQEDQRALSFNHAGITFEIIYNYNVESNYESGITHFYINNKRDYRDLILKRYSSNTTSSNISSIILDKDLTFIPKYEFTPHLVLNPEEINSDIPAQLWYDKANSRIGFTNKQYSIVYQTKNINYIIIQNVLPAKGGGYAELLVQLQEGYPEAIYYVELNALNELAGDIKNLTGLEVLIPEPYYNC